MTFFVAWLEAFKRFILYHCTKKKLSINDFLSKCDQIHRKRRIWSYLLKSVSSVLCSVSSQVNASILIDSGHYFQQKVPFMILFKSNLQYIKCLHQIFVFVCHTYEIFSFPNKDALHKNLHIFFRSQGNAESNSAKTTYQKTVSLSSRTKHMSIERFS